MSDEKPILVSLINSRHTILKLGAEPKNILTTATASEQDCRCASSGTNTFNLSE